MIKIFVHPHRIAIGELGHFRTKEELICWLAAYKDKLPSASEIIKPKFYLFLNFDDVRSEQEAINFGLTPFDELMAELAAETLLEALRAGCQKFIFSCDAGVSRSAGMAEGFGLFLQKLGKPFQMVSSRQTSPNLLVKEKLFESLKKLYFGVAT
ncbi:hypothetical protein Thein_0252 [Thermodesulfatator indicus DSM 15286]|uniref:Tyrosine specific protein phosphatases domain-containing protein n=1 Tax=Thermodesulfatator indicus (strain DSM 15286 / JCM 11887 / CIR29812) TaxID=667014 RepID=F8A9T8_THEID|nr:hypothetical protein [Thermodesulfatator indicus]AEH44136.1 hypothetical protein Thein_0252 [Thermodesulfatator indicus DSM 15286]